MVEPLVKLLLIASLLANITMFRWTRSVVEYSYQATKDLETYRAAYGPDAWTLYNPETGTYT